VANSFVYAANFLPATTGGRVLPANTLQPKCSYIWELTFSDRIPVHSPGANSDAQLGFQYRTSAPFTTAPEPGTIGLLLVCGTFALACRRNRRMR
jgi:hypothetical protein